MTSRRKLCPFVELMIMNKLPIIEQSNGNFAFIVLSAFLWIGLLCSGYFFEVAFWALDGILIGAMVIFIWRDPELLRRLSVWHALLVAYICLYWLSCLYAVNLDAAIASAAKVSSLLPLVIFTIALTQEKYDKFIRQWAWAGAFLTVWGWIFDLYINGRLGSTFGYANTLAILLAIGCCIAWRAYHDNRGSIYLGLLLIQFIGLVQTGSRTVMVLFVCVSIIGLAQLRGTRLRLWLVAVAVAAISYVLLAYYYHINLLLRLLLNWNAPEFQLRSVYWTDGFAMFKENWLLGIGGGGWVTEHNSWYFVKYLHQFYLQMALEIGIGGLILFGLLVAIPWVKNRTMKGTAGLTWVLIAMLLCHVLVDIDFEYPLCMGLFIIMLSRIERITLINP